MRWPWVRPEPTGGKEAKQDAVNMLRQVKSQGDEVERVTRSLRNHRERNHLAAAIERAIRGRAT